MLGMKGRYGFSGRRRLLMTFRKIASPIHVAAWRGRSEVVQLLVERGSPIDIPDTNGRTPLQLAVRACVDSYWTDRRSPESVEILLKAGANAEQVSVPTGYEAIDGLLRLS
jgi:ankyrin repeat protein